MLALATDAFGGRGGIAGTIAIFSMRWPNPGGCRRSRYCRVMRRIGLSHLSGSAKRGRGPGGSPTRLRRRPRLSAASRYRLLRSPAHGAARLADARLSRAKLVIQAHGIEASPRPRGSARGVAADLVLCVSRTGAQIAGWAVLAPERLLVVPNTVGDEFSPGDGGALRTAFGLDGKRVLLTVGRIDARERYKGHDRVIRAIAGLVRRATMSSI